MPTISLSLSYSPRFMKRVVTILGGFLLFVVVSWGQHEVGTSPLEYNTEKYYQQHTSFLDQGNMTKNLYPLCGSNYYLYDTLALPFVDDFSQNHFTTYHSWDWPTSVDSIARVYKLTPDTFAADTQLFKYRLVPTYHYTNDTTIHDSSAVDSILNLPRQLILYGNCENPFIATDTFNVWGITSLRYYWDTITLSVLSAPIFPDGTLNGDTIDTIQVYLPIANNNLWIDNFAYRNISMGIDPPTYGVVTFDGTNEFGKAYSPGANNSYGVADYLTSKPIDLSVGTNIFISFFSQPKGLGYRPDEADSLVLEFYSPITEKWYHQWSSIGDTLSGDTCRAFLQSILPITNTLFLQKGFQFRFKNYGNLSGNLDHWNLDYVRLDKNRNISDLVIDDVAFVYLPLTILNEYTAMPYEQYQLSNRKTKWNNSISNLNNANETINSYKYTVYNEAGGFMNQYPTQYTPPGFEPNTITPFNPNGYTQYQRWSEPDFHDSLMAPLPAGLTCCPYNDSARFTIHHTLNIGSGDVNPENDSIVLHQDFLNYYSYDDGTAEQSMWLGTPGHMAVKFTNNFPDTLRAIQFYFSPIKDVVTTRYITLEVYSGDLNTLVYSTTRQVGVLDTDPNGITNKINNGFTTYIFPDTVIVPLPAGDFYVGWYQSQIFKLNVGHDRNLDNSGNTYYRTTGVWDTLYIPGTLMIRPIVGRNLYKSEIGIEEYWNDQSITLYPNPTNNTIYYQVNGDIDLNGIRIIDIAGKLVYQTDNINYNEVDVSGFAQGLYFMQFLSDQTNQPLTKKFIISR
jgi:hypothetical protein